MRSVLEFVALPLAFVLAGCPGVDVDRGLGIDAAPGIDGRAQYRDARCGSSTSGATSGASCDPYGAADGGVHDVDAIPDAESVDAGPPCNEHMFRYESDTASTVWVTGTFTNWATSPADGALEMHVERAGLFSLTTRIEPEGRHEYKLVVDGTRWIEDPANPDSVPDGFGGRNSVLVLCDAACGDLAAFDWRDSVLYFLLIDRFFDGDMSNNRAVAGASDGDAAFGASAQYEGGDLAGVRAKLPYLADLGATALWLSAPYENRDTAGAAIDPISDAHMYSGYHGYWPSPENIDWSNPESPSPAPRVESRIGTSDDLLALVDDAHRFATKDGHGFRVLFDYVMKHVSDTSGLFASHPDWFARDNGNLRLCGPENLWDDPYWGTRCAFTSYLPPFDMENDAARAWSIHDAVGWARHFGIDGYRLDAIKHVPKRWLTDLRARLSRDLSHPVGDRFYLVGETFAYDDRELIESFVDPDTMLDGQFDFPFKARLCEAVFTPSGSLDELSRWMDGNDRFYGERAIMTTWIGNHDVPRAIHFASRQIGNCREGSHPGNGWTRDFAQPTNREPYERLAIAWAILMTSPGIPLVYYGDEIGLAGGGDPDNRRMMPWTSLNDHQRALYDTVRALANIRATHKVTSRGLRRTLFADRDTWAYRMSGCGEGAEAITVAINRSDDARTIDVGVGAFLDLISGDAIDGPSISLAAREFRVLVGR